MRLLSPDEWLLIGLLLMMVPLSKLPLKVSALAAIFTALTLAYFSIDASSLNGRLATLINLSGSVQQVFADASLNLRAGHIYFSLVHNFFPSLFMSHEIDFMEQYNSFAASTGILIETKSNYILPAIGELLYGGGVLALMLLLFLFGEAVRSCESKKAAIIKVGFIVACLLNPISISYLFLVMFVFLMEEVFECGSKRYKWARWVLRDA